MNYGSISIYKYMLYVIYVILQGNSSNLKNLILMKILSIEYNGLCTK